MSYQASLRALLSVLALALAVSPLAAAEKAAPTPASVAPVSPPEPGEVRELTLYPAKVSLVGKDSAAQLIVTAALTSGRSQDLTGDVEYEVEHPGIVRVTSSGRVHPLANGTTRIRARLGDREVSAAVTTSSCDVELPISFPNQIVPIFTKLGCNSGGCHGKASGQNGFKLSLLGFEPTEDHASLVKEARGRRVLPTAPDHSLLLLKTAGVMAHGGGKRTEVGSDEYRLLRRWIASGLPYAQEDDPVVERIEIQPPQRLLTRSGRQQLAVYAHYTNGTVEDITRRAQYESNDQEIAVVDETGLVRTLSLSGEAAIMARYQGHVTVFRATVPLGLPVPEYPLVVQTLVDRHTHAKWKQLGIMPSELCTDEEFIRRVYLDITGTLPSPDQIRAFLAEKSPAKRDRLVDHLLDRPEYGYYFANKWADILRVRRGNQADRAYGTFVFHDWIRQAISADIPYDEMVRAIVAAVGDETSAPPVVWYKDLTTPDLIVDNLTQVFLGTRIQCAQCHHHPYEKWGQDDYWSLAAFFGRMGRKTVIYPRVNSRNSNEQRLQVLFSSPRGSVRNQKTGQPAEIRPLGGEVMEISADEDPRQKLVDWMTSPENPFFARSVVNRYWAHFFGRGIVDPLDDMRVTNPPSNPELLDALARDFVEHKFSLKHLVATICKSRTYQLSSVPNELNKHDKQNYARYYPKRMSAEVLFDAVNLVTKNPVRFPGLPEDTHSPRRAIMLPDESFVSYFLDVFGRPQRLSPCECERVSEANLAQVLHLLNSDEVQEMIARTGGRADELAKDPRADAEKVEDLFYWVLGHAPSPDKLKRALDHIAEHESNKKLAYENLLWALLNTKEFVFVR